MSCLKFSYKNIPNDNLTQGCYNVLHGIKLYSFFLVTVYIQLKASVRLFVPQ